MGVRLKSNMEEVATATSEILRSPFQDVADGPEAIDTKHS